MNRREQDGTYILVILAAFGVIGITGKFEGRKARALDTAPVTTNMGQ